MPTKKIKMFERRRMRTRSKLRKVGLDKPRLSVHRSSKNIYVQVIDDAQGRTLAAASSLDKDLGLAGKNNAEAAARVGTRQGRRRRSRLFRSRGLHLPREDQGPRRRRPRGRPEVLRRPQWREKTTAAAAGAGAATGTARTAISRTASSRSTACRRR
jgi:large subunit ribosomal protein L18